MRGWLLWRLRPAAIAYVLTVQAVALVLVALVVGGSREPRPDELLSFVMLAATAGTVIVITSVSINVKRQIRRNPWTFAVSLLLLDLDHFKRVNDEIGHLARDTVLAAVAMMLRSSVRREDGVGPGLSGRRRVRVPCPPAAFRWFPAPGSPGRWRTCPPVLVGFPVPPRRRGSGSRR